MNNYEPTTFRDLEEAKDYAREAAQATGKLWMVEQQNEAGEWRATNEKIKVHVIKDARHEDHYECRVNGRIVGYLNRKLIRDIYEDNESGAYEVIWE